MTRVQDLHFSGFYDQVRLQDPPSIHPSYL
jgi:hypothetical protein